ncbi:hypothetical protein PAMA_000193 [Pampus argenteus]
MKRGCTPTAGLHTVNTVKGRGSVPQLKCGVEENMAVPVPEGKKAFWELWHTTSAVISGYSHCFPPPHYHHWGHTNTAALLACGYYCPSVQVSGSTAGSPASSSTPSTSSRQYTRQRITRVNLRDLIFYMEQERETAHSLLLYRALLK